MARELTFRKRAFAENYLKCWNASEAARRSGYKSKANVIGSQLLANPSIQAEIQNRLAKMAMDADEVLARLASHARGSLLPFMDGNEIDLTTSEAKENFYLLKKAKVKVRRYKDSDNHIVTETETEIELHDPQVALINIGRHLKLFTDKMEVDDTSLTDEQRVERVTRILDAARARRAGQVTSGSGSSEASRTS